MCEKSSQSIDENLSVVMMGKKVDVSVCGSWADLAGHHEYVLMIVIPDTSTRDSICTSIICIHM